MVLPSTKTVAENPFPLSAYEKEKLLDSVAYVCRTYLEKYPDHNLDTWSKPDCEAYLRAKSTQIILQFQPDYYRAYAVPEIRRYGHDFMGPYFLLTYYYDRTKEANGSPLDLKFKMELVHVAINARNAQGRYLSLPILNVDDGSAGSVKNIRIGLYTDRKWIPYPYIIWNKDFVEEVKAYFGIFFVATAIISGSLVMGNMQFADALRHAAFQVGSIITNWGQQSLV